MELSSTPHDLRSPVLVAAFQGWNDAGEAATGAVEAYIDAVNAPQIGDMDPEDYYDFQVHRPHIRWAGDERKLDWPRNRLSLARLDGDRDALLLDGVEPNLRWRSFVAAILDTAEELGVRRVVTLGALQVDVPHTRPVPLTGSAANLDGMAAEGLRRSSYQGPTGIVGVLHQAAAARGLEAVTLWVGVPHYLSGTAYLQASVRLVERVAPLVGASAPVADLLEGAEEQATDIGELLAEDPELAEYVGELERRADAEGGPWVPEEQALHPVTGEELAADFERYLREGGGEGPAGTPGE